jgi:hypothetical protein
MLVNRRQLILSAAALGGIEPRSLLAVDAVTADPAAGLELSWTGAIRWGHVTDITTLGDDGKYWDRRLEQAQQQLMTAGGGVVYFPAGEDFFADDIKLKSGVVLRGADPIGDRTALSESYRLPARLEFPRYRPSFRGAGTPVETAFKGIQLQDPAVAANCGVVNLEI